MHDTLLDLPKGKVLQDTLCLSEFMVWDSEYIFPAHENEEDVREKSGSLKKNFFRATCIRVLALLNDPYGFQPISRDLAIGSTPYCIFW